MRSLLLLSFVIVAGCAGEPTAPPASAPSTLAAAPATTYVDKNGAVMTQVSATNAQGELDAKKLVDAKKSGFTVINKDGVQLLCKTEDVTGSRVQKQTNCYTKEQWDSIVAQSQQGVQNYLPTAPPPPSKGGR
jgi:hypothetical protein